ncbi:MAG: amino acid carrier protein [Butyrivibrio sp.]|nr:amino acid carrier protein [Butyrivibrio sp.]
MSRFLWGPVTLALLCGTGLYLTVRFRAYPLRRLFPTLKNIISGGGNGAGAEKGEVSPLGALMTSLAACVGIGNIVGVAAAISIGGAGVLLWMWLGGLLGISTQFAEALLGVRYRQKNSAGEYVGGPMYTLKYGLKNKRLGLLLGSAFALCAVLASFGIGNMVQANSIARAASFSFGIDPRVTGIIMAAAVLATLLGGIKSIARVSGVLVPVMAAVYICGGLIVIAGNAKGLLAGLGDIWRGAFGIKAAAGGGAVSFFTVLQNGIAKGVFSNEAGLGSAAITASAAHTDSDVSQGCVSMCTTFIDTHIICTMTGLVILSAGLYKGAVTDAAELVTRSFETVLGNAGGYAVTAGIVLFAYASIPGWEYMGEKALEFLVKKKIYCYIYRIGFVTAVYVGAVLAASRVWELSQAANALMIFPNLFSLLALSGEAADDIRRYGHKKSR